MSRHHRMHRRRWARVRLAVLDRDGWKCTVCGRIWGGLKGRLEVDHIQPLAENGPMYDLKNLSTKCRPCHFNKTALERGQTPNVVSEARQALLGMVDELL